jgi:hypothetical protein
MEPATHTPNGGSATHPSSPRSGGRARPGLDDGSLDDREGQILIGTDVRRQEGMGDATTPAAEPSNVDPLTVEVALIPAMGAKPATQTIWVGAGQEGDPFVQPRPVVLAVKSRQE